MQRQLHKERSLREKIKVTDPKLEEKAKAERKKKIEESQRIYDVAAYPFGADELLFRTEKEGK